MCMVKNTIDTYNTRKIHAEFCILIDDIYRYRYFEHLCESVYYIEQGEFFRTLLDYFEDTWLGKTVCK